MYEKKKELIPKEKRQKEQIELGKKLTWELFKSKENGNKQEITE